MKKRMISFLLALILIASVIPATVITANAASKWTTSINAVKILTEKQGFEAKVYKGADGKMHIGYGTIVKNPDGTEASETEAKALYPDAITADKALELVQTELKETIDKQINAFTEKHNLSLTQYQHDALALYSQRKGTDWMTDATNKLYLAVTARKTGDDFIYAIVEADKPGLTDLEALKVQMNLRLSEANMYLNGGYGYNRPSGMSYAVLAPEGEGTAARELVIYNTSSGYELGESKAKVPTGKVFFGWFAADSNSADKQYNGAPITKLTGDHYGKLFFAKNDDLNKDTFAKYEIKTSALPSRNYYNAAVTRANLKSELVKGELANNTTFTVTAEKMVENDFKWIYGTGKNTKGQSVTCWVPLGNFLSIITPDEKIVATATITSKTDVVVYYGASEDSDSTGKKVSEGQTYNVYATQEEKSEKGNKLWGRINVSGTVGWIDLANAKVVYTSGTTDSAVGKTGKIINAEEVNVRADAGTEFAKRTTLKKDTKVTILETKYNGAAQWGKVRWEGLRDGYTEGWVYMYYVGLDGASHSNPGNSVGDVKYTGVVTSNTPLNVRKSADIYSARVRSLPNGTKINVYETATSRNMKWGRIGDNEWVCLAYVKLTEVANSGSSGSGSTTTTEIQATVTSNTLDVMKNYNNNSQKVGTLKKGDVVTILERNTENTGTGTRIWGRFIKGNLEGWINLAYADVKTVTNVTNPDNSGSSGNTGTGNANGAEAVIANCMAVNVREAAGTGSKQLLKLNNGTVVKVYEKVTKDNAPWARITWNNGASEGWACMYYVEMKSSTNVGNGNNIGDTNSNTISAVGTVNSNIALNVRAGAGLGFAKIGALNKGAKVTVYEQVSADGMIWGRIPYGNGSGYVCMSYINVDAATSSGKGVMGTIARCFKAVNVRSNPGTNNALVATINVGSRVEVFEQKLYSNQYWGRVAQGWICMDYVLLDSELPPGVILDETKPTTETTKATEPTETINRDNEVLYYINGTTNADVEVHNDASANSLKVGSIKAAMALRIEAVKFNSAGELWGRVDHYATAGWVNMKNVTYSVKGYVNTDEQPVFADASTGSTVKGTLPLNTELTINKLTVNGGTVYGWVENGLNGWIPMGRISDEKIAVIPVYDGTTDDNGINIEGTTNAEVNVIDSIGSGKVVFKLKAGTAVKMDKIKMESGSTWGNVVKDGVTGWVNLSNVNYTVRAYLTEDLKVRNTKTEDVEDDSNVIGTESAGTVLFCEISFDVNGNPWGKVSGEADSSTLHGGYIYLNTAAITVNGLVK